MKRQDRINTLIDSRKTVLIATTGTDNSPLSSYAPYCSHEEYIYLFLSHMARHTANLISNPVASIMFIEDESECADVFARKRLEYQCRVNTIDKDQPLHGEVLDLFAERFGEIMDTLTALPDFVLFQLVPLQGNFVEGFGKAHRISHFA